METSQLMKASDLREKLNNMVHAANFKVQSRIEEARVKMRKQLDESIQKKIIELYEHTKTITKGYNKLEPMVIQDWEKSIGPLNHVLTQDDLDQVFKKYKEKGYRFEIRNTVLFVIV